MPFTVPALTAILCNDPLSGKTVEQRARVALLHATLVDLDADYSYASLLESATSDGLLCEGALRTEDRIRSTIWSALVLEDTTLACYNPDQLTGIEAELVHKILTALA